MEKMMDRCGLFGMFDNNGFHTSHLIYYGLFSMQHRGMEAAGICVNDNQGNFSYVKDEGLVTEVFDEMKLEKLQGHAGIGHILRYDGSDARENAQPIVIRYTSGHMAVALNGGLTNIEEIRHDLELKGSVFQTMEAAEVISVLISRARNNYPTIEEAIASIMPMLKGGYAMLVMTPRKVIGVRDPQGIRPLVLGREDHSWFLSSETCAFDELNVDYVRDIQPGRLWSSMQKARIPSRVCRRSRYVPVFMSIFIIPIRPVSSVVRKFTRRDIIWDAIWQRKRLQMQMRLYGYRIRVWQQQPDMQIHWESLWWMLL